MMLDFSVDGESMGGTRSLWDASMPRRVFCKAVGTDVVESIELIKNGKVIHTHYGADVYETMVYTDKSLARSGDYYYARVIQANDGIAWASPVWLEVKEGKRAMFG